MNSPDTSVDTSLLKKEAQEPEVNWLALIRLHCQNIEHPGSKSTKVIVELLLILNVGWEQLAHISKF